jgi:REP element-mobilizing transposase RayT
MKIESIDQGFYYHIFNQGINKENLFYTAENYKYFLRLYTKYVHPVVHTYAWCLMPNHFHLLVYIKTNQEINDKELRYRTVDKPSQVSASKQFSILFKSYAQSINKQNNRVGSLFRKPFKRIKVNNDDYLKRLIYYIHNNPVHHGFEKKLIDYEWTSYYSIISQEESNIQRSKVIELFHDIDNFKYFHDSEHHQDDFGELFLE